MDIQASQQNQSQQNANETDNKPSFERKAIENTPFQKIYQEGNGWFLVMGEYRVTEPFATEKQLDTYIKGKPWDLLVTVIGIVTEKVIQMNK